MFFFILSLFVKFIVALLCIDWTIIDLLFFIDIACYLNRTIKTISRQEWTNKKTAHYLYFFSIVRVYGQYIRDFVCHFFMWKSWRMKNNIHFMIVTTLSMVITFLLHCSLKDTKANGFFIQNTLIDTTCDVLLHVCCFWNNGICMFF